MNTLIANPKGNQEWGASLDRLISFMTATIIEPLI